MFKPFIALMGAALLLGACGESQQAVIAPPPPPPPQATSFMVFFDWDRSDLSGQALATIHQAADAYKSTGRTRITAIGHTDTSGPADYNMALSLRRANVVKAALSREGVAETSIVTIGRGEDGLLVQTGDGVREPQNRRAEIVFGEGQTSSVFSDPASYCKALTQKLRQYNRREQIEQIANAVAQCEAGNYAGGIPTLEEHLIGSKIPLPAPGYRWPGKSYSPS